MFCPQCGMKLPEDAMFCPNCGYKLQSEQNSNHGSFENQNYNYNPLPFTPPQTSPFEKAKKILNDPLLLTICILLSAAAAVKLLISGLDIILVLIVIGMWMLYSGATGQNTQLIGNGINLASIAVKIQFIVTNVLIGIIFVCGIILFLLFAAMGDSAGSLIYEAFEEAGEALYEMGLSSGSVSDVYYTIESMFYYINGLNGFVIGIFIFAFCFFFSAIMLLINILFTGRFSKYLSKANHTIKEGKPAVITDRRCSAWLLAYGIFMAIGSITTFVSSASILALICNVCLAASCIMASVIMKKED